MGYYQGKKVWITGASSGIGKALAVRLAAEGASLVLSSRRMDQLREVATLCTDAPKVDIVLLDHQDHAQMGEELAKYSELIADVDILINNAGISQRSSVAETDFNVYRRLVDVNYLGTVKITLAVLKHFIRKGGGQLVVITSIAGKFGVPGRSGYSASKMALHGFFESLRAELPDRSVGITLVVPGFTKTEISVNALSGAGQAMGVREVVMDAGMTPEYLAERILRGVEKREDEIIIGGFKEARLAVWLSRIFPSWFRKLIAGRKVT